MERFCRQRHLNDDFYNQKSYNQLSMNDHSNGYQYPLDYDSQQQHTAIQKIYDRHLAENWFRRLPKCSINREFLLIFGKRLLRYLFGYSVLIGLVLGMLVFYLQVIVSRDEPVLIGRSSLLANGPSLAVHPRPDSMTSLIKIDSDVERTYQFLTSQLFAFLLWYDLDKSTNLEDCWDTRKKTDPFDRLMSCKVNLNMGVDCNEIQYYGYDVAQPCFVITLNTMYGWIPKIAANSLANTEGHAFSKTIKQTNNTKNTSIDGIKIECGATYPEDRVKLGDICYYDDTTINERARCRKRNTFGLMPHYYYPYLRQANYRNPLVFIELDNPVRNQVLSITCKAIADNIHVDVSKGLGSVQFEVLLS